MLLESILPLASLAALAVAAPATAPDTDLSKREALVPFALPESSDTLKPRSIGKRNAINISMFGGNGFTGQVHGVSQIGDSPACYPVSANRRSIHTWADCIVRTWSGTNCQGSSQNIPATQCWDYLYGSVSVVC